ncbi:hypothetical protein CIK05_13890 [Bdellovibrio sp. qaytius]|nr:hypothetical protein CIK05_13890 [Bdellovibrio sp. qaytius]
MDRRNFISTVGFLGLGTALLQLTSCSSGSSGAAAAAAATPQNCSTADPVTAYTTGAHASDPHYLSLTQVQINNGVNGGVPVTYSLSTASGHSHTVTLSLAQHQALQANTSVTGLTTSATGHTHPMDITCA